MGKALPQLRWIFIAFADVEKAASAVNGKIQPTIAVEVYSESAERGILQRHNPLYAAGGQDAKGCRFIVAAQIESFVKGLVSRFDGFGAEAAYPAFPAAR